MLIIPVQLGRLNLQNEFFNSRNMRAYPKLYETISAEQDVKSQQITPASTLHRIEAFSDHMASVSLTLHMPS